MDERTWLGRETARAAAELVRSIETRTAAELVVTVRARSAAYRHVDLAVGAALGFAVLCIYIYYPATFTDDLIPLAIALCFAAGAVASANISVLKRPFVSRRAMVDAAKLGARAAFVDGRVGATRARTGVLVYVSIFERAAVVLPDIGVDVGAKVAAWTAAVARIERAVEERATLEELSSALRELGEVLAVVVPPTKNDVNELPDAVVA